MAEMADMKLPCGIDLLINVLLRLEVDGLERWLSRLISEMVPRT